MVTLKYSRSKATFKTHRIHYFITIEKQQKKDYISRDELDTVYTTLNGLIPDLEIEYKVYELGTKYYQLHMHAIVSTFTKIYFKKYSKYGNFRVYWTPVYSREILDIYIRKQCINKYEQEQLFDINYYRHHYGFV